MFIHLTLVLIVSPTIVKNSTTVQQQLHTLMYTGGDGHTGHCCVDVWLVSNVSSVSMLLWCRFLDDNEISFIPAVFGDLVSLDRL